ncbi:hypothetical protein D3C80_1936060 [compost metagenome]
MDFFQIEKPIALGVVGFSRQDRLDEQRNQGRVHLTVPVDFDDDTRAVVEGGSIAGHDRTTHAFVDVMGQHLDPRVVTGGQDMPA